MKFYRASDILSNHTSFITTEVLEKADLISRDTRYESNMRVGDVVHLQNDGSKVGLYVIVAVVYTALHDSYVTNYLVRPYHLNHLEKAYLIVGR